MDDRAILQIALCTILANLRNNADTVRSKWINKAISTADYIRYCELIGRQQKDYEYLLAYPHASTYTENLL